MKKASNKTRGYFMLGAGFFVILMIAINYIIGIGNTSNIPIFILGLVFVVLGMNYLKKKN
jgi:MFS superfamily sulfate permease-like transporter